MTALSERRESEDRGFHRLASIFKPPVINSNKCHRCKDNVYHAEKIGPVHEAVYHKHCFKCSVCDVHLTMKNYFTNQVRMDDKEIYCSTHHPRVGAVRLDQAAVGIRGPVRAQENFKKMTQKVNSEIRKPGTIRIPSYDASAVAIKRILTSQKAHDYTMAVNKEVHKVSIGPDAMGIKQPIAAQKLQTHYERDDMKHNYQPRVSYGDREYFLSSTVSYGDCD